MKLFAFLALIISSNALAINCPISNLVGTYKVVSTTCESNGQTHTPDANFVPSAYKVEMESADFGWMRIAYNKQGEPAFNMSFGRYSVEPDDNVSVKCVDESNYKMIGFDSCYGRGYDCVHGMQQIGTNYQAFFYRTENGDQFQCQHQLQKVN